MEGYLEHLGLVSENCVGLLTAVSMENLQVCALRQDDWDVTCFATVGVSNAARAGDGLRSSEPPAPLTSSSL